ncbi:8-amino-7-oxononanoate synthase [Rhizoctonia solani 123E]|uniref:8-amino-7-oxononanoate synthase n=1 Tax=Rhizoctonia solani 123E TaxID=1423351 RepID=A0A074S3A3_9AGAM|nr:8-amino-7-oxononanoate synthase [Rhizoctonia solani 123E]
MNGWPHVRSRSSDPLSSMMSKETVLHAQMRAALDSRRVRSIIRRPHPDAFIPAPQNLAVPPPKPLIDFSSNDYLSLTTYPPLRDHLLATLQAAPQILGSGGSRLLDGTHDAHFQLEKRLAKFFVPQPHYPPPTALLFNSGFDANVALFSALPQPGDWIIYDALVHASVHDGMRSSRLAASRRIAFKHSCVRDLEAKIRYVLNVETEKGTGGNKGTVFIALEALYSMDGDLAPLADILKTVESLIPPERRCVIVDEAHSTGIYGDGRGLVEQLGLGSRVHVRLHTFGKAMASSGGVVMCDYLTREYLINYARSFIFTTAPTVASVIAMGCSFDMVDNGTTRRLATQLFKISTRFTTSLRIRLRDVPSRIMALPPFFKSEPTPIVPILTPYPRPLAQHLREHGFLARPITHPTVPKGEERVRICLHAANTEEEVDGLVDALVEWAKVQRLGKSIPMAKL